MLSGGLPPHIPRSSGFSSRRSGATFITNGGLQRKALHRSLHCRRVFVVFDKGILDRWMWREGGAGMCAAPWYSWSRNPLGAGRFIKSWSEGQAWASRPRAPHRQGEELAGGKPGEKEPWEREREGANGYLPRSLLQACCNLLMYFFSIALRHWSPCLCP